MSVGAHLTNPQTGPLLAHAPPLCRRTNAGPTTYPSRSRTSVHPPTPSPHNSISTSLPSFHFRRKVNQRTTPSLPPMALLPVLISIAAFFLACKLYQRLRFRLPPGPNPWPIVGNLYDIKPVRFRCFAEWSQAYGPIISVWFGSTLNVIVSNSELAKEVLKEKDQQLADRHRSRSAAKFSRDGQDLIWADYGPHYVKVRKVCTVELFSPKRLEALRPIREDEVTAMVESIFKDITNPGMSPLLSFTSFRGCYLFSFLDFVYSFNYITLFIKFP